MKNLNLLERTAFMLAKSRNDAGISQAEIAKRLNVAKSTVQKWESGDSAPTLATTFEWFEAIGVPMYPYMMATLYPKEVARLSPDADNDELRKTLALYINELDDLHMRELLYLLHGTHGSSPTGAMDLLTAYLHLPLGMRVCITNNVLMNYQIAEASDLLKDDKHILPAYETLQRYMNTAKEAVLNGKETYLVVKEDIE